MSTFYWLVKNGRFPTLEALNQAILTKDPSAEGLHGADQIISIQWTDTEYLVTWRVRKWQEEDIWED